MQPSADRRRGGGPVATASRSEWRPRSRPSPAAFVPSPAAGPDAAGPILPLPTPASEARPSYRRSSHGNNNGNNHSRRSPAPPQEQNDDTRYRRRGPPPERPPPAPTAPARERAPAPPFPHHHYPPTAGGAATLGSPLPSRRRMQSSDIRRHGGGPVATASSFEWRPLSRPSPAASVPGPAAGPDAAGPILPLPIPASEARLSHRRPNHGNNGNDHSRRSAPPQEQNDNARYRRRVPPPERPAPAPTAPARERAPAPAAAARGDGAVPQLVLEIQDRLARGAVDCMICYDMVRRSAPIWSCGTCFSIFHLPCIREWVRSPAPAAVASPAADPASPSWRCPGCQSVYATAARDLAYTCFCGNRGDPPNDHSLTPHSCGNPCFKPLERAEPPGAKGEDVDATRCTHVCVLQCHPGPCPPCKAFAPDRPCPCGKQIIVRRCADRSTPVTCGRPCEQMLPCKRHRCEKDCHTGSCGDCAVLISVRCFCGKKNETLLCGDMMVKGTLPEEDGVFSCYEVCGHALACLNHACKDMCHPGPCGQCELMPGICATHLWKRYF